MKGSSAWPRAETRKGSSARPLATTKWLFCVGVAQSALAAALPPKLLLGLVEALLLYGPNLLLIYNIYIKVRAPGSRECTRSDLCLNLSRFFSFSKLPSKSYRHWVCLFNTSQCSLVQHAIAIVVPSFRA